MSLFNDPQGVAVQGRVYNVRVKCKNCGRESLIQESYGKLIDAVAKKKSCDDCGCSAGWIIANL